MPVEVRVTTKIDQAAVAQLMGTQVLAHVQRGLDRVRDRAKAEITAAGRVRTGAMRDGVVSEPATFDGSTIRGRVVATEPHSIYQHEGTADFIYPRRARVLRFQGRSGAYVFAPRVRGVTGHPFMTLAVERMTIDDLA